MQPWPGRTPDGSGIACPAKPAILHASLADIIDSHAPQSPRGPRLLAALLAALQGPIPSLAAATALAQTRGRETLADGTRITMG